MAMMRYSSATIVEPNIKSEDWQKSVCCGRKSCACGSGNCRTKIAKTIIAKYSPEKYLLSHATIVAAVDTDEAKESKSKYKDYLIKPAYSKLVNNNGDAWTKPLLAATYKTFIGCNNFCFPAGTRILMSDGTYKSIEFIKKGDKVINRKGEIASVTDTFSRVVENLIEIKSKNILSRSLFTTPEHPFWIYQARKTCPKTGRPNTFNRDKIFYDLKSWTGFSYGVHRAKGEIFSNGLIPSWVDSSKIDPDRDFLTHPIPSKEISDSEMNENRAELLGWYLAEGFLGNKNIFSELESDITFCLGNDELDIANRISELLIKEFGDTFRTNCEPRIYESDSGSLTLCLCNKVAAAFFKDWGGKYAWAKKMPEKALWLPKKLQAIILKNTINGDGCGETGSRGYSLEMKTQSLIQQLMLISWRLGLLPTYKETGVLPRYTECDIVDGYEIFSDPITGKRSRPGYILRFSVRDSKKLNTFLNIEDIRIAERESNRVTHIFDHEESKYFISKIDSVKPTDVSCTVHNIQVEEDNSYIAEGVIVHNCEHVQIPALSKGKVVDAILREVPIGKDASGKELTTYYVDILVATERKHKDLVAKIESGKLCTLSMGCKIAFSICTKCGNKACDETEACDHVKYEKNNTFYDDQNIQRKVAELCGAPDVPDSVTFVDASWVENPAFTGAVVRNIVNPSEDIMAKIEAANKKESFEAKEGDYLKAANKTAAPKKPADAPAEEPSDEPPAKEPADEPVDTPIDEPVDTPTEDVPAAPPAPESTETDYKKWKKDIKEKILKEMGKELTDEFKKKDEEEGPRELETLDESLIQPTASVALKQMWKMKTNWDNYLQKTAGNLDKKNFEKLKFGTYMLLTSSDLTSLSDYGYSRRDFLAVMSCLDQCFKNPLAKEIRKALAEINSTEGQPQDEIVFSLSKLAGRKLSSEEIKKALLWLKLMNSYQD